MTRPSSALSHQGITTTAVLAATTTTTTTETTTGANIGLTLLAARSLNNTQPPSSPSLMFPAQSQSTAKRKAANMETSMNPLLAAAAAKRAKKDKSSNANKRKLLPDEDAPGGLFIVRNDQNPFHSSQPLRATSSQPLPHQSKPPSKKFRADSQPPSSSLPLPPRSSALARKPSSSLRLLEEDEGASHSDADLERDVQAMEDETDRLRRSSRANTLIDQSILASSSSKPQDTLINNNTLNNNSMFQFPTPSMSRPKPPSSNGAGGGGGRRQHRSSSKQPASRMDVDLDSQVPIAENETPQQQRNKRLREGAMAAIVDEREQDGGSGEEGRGRYKGLSGSGPSSKPGHRRASSLSRGKRISTSYEQTGVITQPHNSVSETSFYKHIDADLPEVERVRQLLIWCSLRSASTYNKPSPAPSASQQPPSTSTTTTTTKTPLPPLSAKASEALKRAQEEFVRALAEKRVDLNVHAAGAHGEEEQVGELRENEQNVRNRNWEVTYSSHIQRAQAEDEAWKKVSYEYDAYAKKLQASLERRKKALEQLKASRLTPPPYSTTAAKSKKGKGKARATSSGVDGDDNMDDEDGDDEKGGQEKDDDESWLALYPHPHELPPAFQRGAQLARTVLSQSRRRRRPPSPPLPATSTSTSTSTSSSTSALPSTSKKSATPPPDLEQTILSKLPTLQYKLDILHTHLNTARATTAICERILDERFRILNRHLDARMRSASIPPPPPPSTTTTGDGDGGGGERRSAGHVLTTYIPRSPSSRSARTLYPPSLPPGITTTTTSTSSASRSQSVPPPPPPPSLPSTSHLASPRTLLRTLTRIDAARPPAQIGDAARRAAREVQRAGESGLGPVAGDRRVTLLPVMMTSGLTVPATPRKGGLAPPGTPGRRTPGRERTPGR